MFDKEKTGFIDVGDL
jgi:Ca2+-binding EF-hand superfamily protein